MHVCTFTYIHMYLCALLYVSTYVCSLWSPRNCIPVIDLLDEWIPLFSDWIVTNILDQLIMPKLHVSTCKCYTVYTYIMIHTYVRMYV